MQTTKDLAVVVNAKNPLNDAITLNDLNKHTLELHRIQKLSKAEQREAQQEVAAKTIAACKTPRFFNLLQLTLTYNPYGNLDPDPLTADIVSKCEKGSLTQFEAIESAKSAVCAFIHGMDIAVEKGINQFNGQDLVVPADAIDSLINAYGETALIKAILDRENSKLATTLKLCKSAVDTAKKISELEYLGVASGCMVKVAPAILTAVKNQTRRLAKLEEVHNFSENSLFDKPRPEILSIIKAQNLNNKKQNPHNPIGRDTFKPETTIIELSNLGRQIYQVPPETAFRPKPQRPKPAFRHNGGNHRNGGANRRGGGNRSGGGRRGNQSNYYRGGGRN